MVEICPHTKFYQNISTRLVSIKLHSRQTSLETHFLDSEDLKSIFQRRIDIWTTIKNSMCNMWQMAIILDKYLIRF